MRKPRNPTPVIRVDAEVYWALRKHFRSEGETFNDTLRRLLGLPAVDKAKGKSK